VPGPPAFGGSAGRRSRRPVPAPASRSQRGSRGRGAGCQWHEEARLQRQRDETPFKLRVGDDKGVAIEEVSEPANALKPLSLTDRPAEHCGIDEVQLVRFIQRPLEVRPAEACGNVEQGANRRRDRDAIVDGDVTGFERRSAMGNEGGLANVPGPWDRHMNRGAPLLIDLPKGGRAGVTQNGSGATGKDGGHPFRRSRPDRRAHGVDAWAGGVQAPAANAVGDGVARVAEAEKLLVAHLTLLARGEGPDRRPAAGLRP
jgi:hypothetical protein